MIRVWKCEYCNFAKIDEAHVYEHEMACDWNPKQKRCQTCANDKDTPFLDFCMLNINKDKHDNCKLDSEECKQYIRKPD